MEMRVNTSLIIEKRKLKAWSQQHLADISGLSLRTIQRIENTGNGSLDSIKAIASAFSMLPAEVMQQELKYSVAPKKVFSIFGFLSGLLATGFLYSSLANADTIALDVLLSASESEEYEIRMEEEYGNNMEVNIRPNLKLVFIPEIINEGEVEIIIKAYDTSGEQAGVELGSNSIVALENEASSIVLLASNGLSYSLNITPNF